jgi:hypothetical protein
VKPSPAMRAGFWVGWALAVAGFVGGLAWKLVAPVAKIRMESDGGYYVDPSPRQYVEADACFAAISIVVAVVAGYVVWRRLREQPTAAVVSLALGGTVASVLVWQVGKYLGRLDRAAAIKAKIGTIIDDSLDLGAKGLLLVLPIVAVATWLVLDLATQQRRRAAFAALPPAEPVPMSPPASDSAPA